MPRARPKPTLSLTLSPERRRALADHVSKARRKAEAARERRERASPPPSTPDLAVKAARVGKRRRTRIETLDIRLAQLAGQRAEALAQGAYELVTTLDRQADDARVRLRLAQGRASVRAEKLARRGRGQARDRFSELVKRSDVLQPVHLEIADALRDAVLMAGMAGGTPGARSGQAGDGKGNMRRVETILGMAELGEEFWGALGTPGVGGPGTPGGRKSIKRVCRASDGGAAQAADSVRRARRLMGEFADACRDAARNHQWAAEVAVRVILRNQTVSRALDACAELRKSEGLKVAENVMVSGLEAVAPKLGVLVD